MLIFPTVPYFFMALSNPSLGYVSKSEKRLEMLCVSIKCFSIKNAERICGIYTQNTERHFCFSFCFLSRAQNRMGQMLQSDHSVCGAAVCSHDHHCCSAVDEIKVKVCRTVSWDFPMEDTSTALVCLLVCLHSTAYLEHYCPSKPNR